LTPWKIAAPEASSWKGVAQASCQDTSNCFGSMESQRRGLTAQGSEVKLQSQHRRSWCRQKSIILPSPIQCGLSCILDLMTQAEVALRESRMGKAGKAKIRFGVSQDRRE
jgi:hypothetical protein